MSAAEGGDRWQRINELFHLATEQDCHARATFLTEACGDDSALLAEVARLIRAHEHAEGFFTDAVIADAADLLHGDGGAPIGRLLGAYRLVRELGRGGMGAVYLAERADDHYEKRVAVKLIKRGMDTDAALRQFRHERQILAGLEHPNIAHLLDAGASDEGQPFFVMEFVDGQTIDRYCAERRLSVDDRLRLFLQVCAAVSHAHQHLVVHRDLKPSNIIVTGDGVPKLLDFGIAKILGQGSQTDTIGTIGGVRPMTPEYASPEQLRGLGATTLSDVYSLGVLLYELLTGQPPFHFSSRTPADVAQALAAGDPVKPSDVAEPGERRTLRGDLDSIVLMALRHDRERRYQSVEQLSLDIRRHLDGMPVIARQDTVGQRAVKFARRNWVAVTAALLIGTSMTAGLIGTTWQARRAERAASRATATKDFLIGVFKASDPRIASDKPRGQITAKELLDLTAPKIAQTFAADPDTQIELLGITADIYRELGDGERRAALRRQQVELARTRHGDLHPAVVEGLLDQAREANGRQDDAAALRILDEADGLIRRAGRDHSADRARWWLNRALALDSDPNAQSEHKAALAKAVEVFSEVAPWHPEYVTALSDLGHLHNNRQEVAAAIPYFRQAIAVAERLPDRDDAFLVNTRGNLGVALQCVRDFDAAEAEYEAASELARRTKGETGQAYWIVVTRRARMAHLLGDRVRAYALFDPMLQALPRETVSASGVAWVREFYAGCLAAEGRAALAIPLLEASERAFQASQQYWFDLVRVRGVLGDAYDRAGRTDEARRALQASLDGWVARSPADSPYVLNIRERWGRFLLAHGDHAGAERQFREVLAQAHDRPLIAIALAYGGLGKLSLAAHDAVAAVAASREAVERFDRATGGIIDMRSGPYLWLIHAAALRETGDRAGTREWAQKALDASRRYDDPSSSTIAEAEAAVRAASQ